MKLIYLSLLLTFLSVSVLMGNTDSDGDLIPDDVETLWGMNPGDPDDARLDMDNDGVSALLEYAMGGSPEGPDEVFQFETSLNQVKVRELLNAQTTRVNLGWSDNLADWNRAGFLDAAYYADSVVSSSSEELDSPIGPVREWTYQLAVDQDRYFRTEVEPAVGGTEYAAVFRKLHKGVNLDVSRPKRGVWFKNQYHVDQMQAIAEVGFESVRIFMPYYADVAETEEQIKDALDNNLAIVVCMWGLGSWANNISSGELQIAQKWGDLARRWKDYPSDLVIEILNEPEGIGFSDSALGFTNSMRLYNAAAQAIRDEDPDRPILIGAPGHNDSVYLDPYVTEEHLTYTFDDGTGFYDDPNTAVAIHFYNPRHADGLNFAMWTQPLGSNEARWKDPITQQIMSAVDWQNTIGTKIPVITTEWGCWLFPERDASGDMERWLDHHFELFNTHDFGNMWYAGIQHNQRSFAIFDTELGWNPIVTPRLTGQAVPTTWPNLDQVINGEFFENQGWQLTTNEITAAYLSSNGFSGTTMLKLTVPELEGGGQLFLQTLNTHTEPPGRTLIHLIEGQSYRISFIARSSDGRRDVEEGLMQVLLKDVISGEVYYDSSDIIIATTETPYELFYTHTVADAMDVRLEFDVGGKAQVLYLDKVEMVRHGPTGYTVTVNTDSGTSVADFSIGYGVDIDASPAPEGYSFQEWVFDPAVPSGADSGSITTSFRMPAHDLTATAVYAEGSAPTYTLTVITDSGTSNADYMAGDDVQIDANPAPVGDVFDVWEFSPSTPSGADAASAITSFKMPSNDLTATATYRDPSTINILVNGDFEQGTAPWALWLHDATASYSVVNGEAVISITSAGSGIAKPQLVQSNVNLTAGTEHSFSFRGRADAAKRVPVYYAGEFVGEFNLTTEMQSFSSTFTPATASGRLDFLFGENDADAVIDDVFLAEGISGN
jgi:hypothetical protein